MSLTPLQKTFEGFSVSHAAILDGTQSAEDVASELDDIYGVRDAGIAVNDGNYDNTGDESVLSSWFWFNYAELTVKSGYIPFSTVALLTGADLTSTSAADGWTVNLPLWEVRSMNQPVRPVLVRVPSKDAAGNVRTMDFVLYRVQFQPLKFTGPTYKTGLEMDYGGRALTSTVDETGTPLAHRAIARLVNSPGNTVS